MRKWLSMWAVAAISVFALPHPDALTASAAGMPGVASGECGAGSNYCMVFKPGSWCWNGEQMVWNREACLGPDDPRCT